jgi:hypothetical protein
MAQAGYMTGMQWPKKEVYWISAEGVLHVSVPFTWCLPRVRDRLMQRSFEWSLAKVGGPAVDLMPDYLAGIDGVELGGQLDGVLQRVNPLATRTTLGCPARCAFCGVGVRRIEGGTFVELADWPDLPVLCDNNLLAASQVHLDRVFDRLEKHTGVDFNQGIDMRRLEEYHAERMARLDAIIRLALDHAGDGPQGVWGRAYERLRKAGVTKARIRSYVLIGFDSGPDECWERCRWVESHGIKALPMWFHPLDALDYNGVTAQQEAFGWTHHERRRIMSFFYLHKADPDVRYVGGKGDVGERLPWEEGE